MMNETQSDELRQRDELARRRAWLRSQDRGWLLRCAEAEAGRARLSMDGRSDLSTVYYFSREAFGYAAALLDAIATCKRCGGIKPAGQSCGCFDNGGE